MAALDNLLDNGSMRAIASAVTTVGDDQGTIFISYVLLGIFFGSLLYLVVVDMWAKYRSGELRDDMQGVKSGLVLMLMAVPMLFVTLFAKIASLFRRKRAGPGEVDIEAVADGMRTTQAIIERLAAKTTSHVTILKLDSLGSTLEIGN